MSSGVEMITLAPDSRVSDLNGRSAGETLLISRSPDEASRSCSRRHIGHDVRGSGDFTTTEVL